MAFWIVSTLFQTVYWLYFFDRADEVATSPLYWCGVIAVYVAAWLLTSRRNARQHS